MVMLLLFKVRWKSHCQTVKLQTQDATKVLISFPLFNVSESLFPFEIDMFPSSTFNV